MIVYHIVPGIPGMMEGFSIGLEWHRPRRPEGQIVLARRLNYPLSFEIGTYDYHRGFIPHPIRMAPCHPLRTTGLTPEYSERWGIIERRISKLICRYGVAYDPDSSDADDVARIERARVEEAKRKADAKREAGH